MAFAWNDNVRLYYEIQGQGTPVVLVMGLGGSGRAWGLQLPAFTRHHQVVLPDNRGAGHSDAPPGPYDNATLAEDLAAVFDAAELAAAHVVGISLGGLIARAFHHRYPDRVRSLTLAATGPVPDSPEHAPAEPAVRDVLHMDRHSHDMRTLTEHMNPVFYHPDYRARVPDLTERLLQFHEREPQPPHAYHAQLAAARTPLPEPAAETGTVPCLVLHGSDDRVWPPDNARALAETIPGARLEWIADAGHMLPMEKPRAFNRHVLDFLAAVDSASVDDP
ncbi:MAG: alpha/beta fold hydrolase [Ectothiorhodospiraceae bacterium]